MNRKRCVQCGNPFDFGLNSVSYECVSCALTLMESQGSSNPLLLEEIEKQYVTIPVVKKRKKKKMKIPITNEMPKYKHKGVPLKPLTEEEAMSLDERDVVKFVGKVTHPAYAWSGRQAYILRERPKFDPLTKKLTFTSGGFYTSKTSSHYANWALVSRGDKDGVRAKSSQRFISMNLRGFKRKVEELAKHTIERIDHHLKELPLHKKMELFKDIPEKEKLVYDFVYKDFEKVLGEEDLPDGEPATEG